VLDLLDFSDISFVSGMGMKRLSDDLDHLVGVGLWHDTFTIRNTTLLWLVHDIVSAMKSDKVLCGVAGMYPGFVAGILNHVNEINFHVLSNGPLKYSVHIKKCISGTDCTISFMPFEGIYFKLYSSSGETIAITFEKRYVEGKLPSVLKFA
jgi:hypothetical protein